jgi:hypothetical protein
MPEMKTLRELGTRLRPRFGCNERCEGERCQALVFSAPALLQSRGHPCAGADVA